MRIVAVALAVAIIAGVAYEQLARWQDRQRLPQVGRSVDIGGRSLDIYCSGEGDPAVILNSGAGATSRGWAPVQAQIARFARVCSYDRAGCGWSDPGPFPRTAEANAKDLHALLPAARVPGPYVLVGPSFGGFDARVYNGLYPGEVAGMVLVDASHEEEDAGFPRAFGPRSRPDMTAGGTYLISVLLSIHDASAPARGEAFRPFAAGLFDAPDAVIAAIREVGSEVRKNKATR